MSRWIVVSNRLPFRLAKNRKGLAPSSGGLVTAISGIKSKAERLWVGCAPEGMSENDWQNLKRTLPDSSRYAPLFIPDALYDSYYNGFCNDVLWPLLHYQNELVKFQNDAWEAYCEVNQRFADVILQIAKDDDMIWIHDFHFFLLPQMLKKRNPRLRVGFFLHIPFPTSEVFRQLPVRERLLEALLAADLVGFHDYSYLRHFCSSLLRLLGVDSSFLSVEYKNHTTRLGVFPVSIDTEDFRKKADSTEVKSLMQTYKKPEFMFLGVDRLDYIKGIDLKLKSFASLLKNYPKYHGKVSLMQIAVPTRQDVPEYMRLKQETEQLIGEINGAYSTPTWTPIHYLYSSVTQTQLLALYQVADALLVSSKRDGMNLVALEYIATQSRQHPGIVLLSEFAGALQMLSHTVPINPWDIEGTAKKMLVAMEMPKQEKIFRLEAMAKHMEEYTATDWATSFIRQLEEAQQERPGYTELVRPELEFVDRLVERIIDKNPSRISLLLDYDGTLVPIESQPELAVLSPNTKRELMNLLKYPWLDVVIVSGRDSKFLSSQLEDLHVCMAAEHGAKFYDPAIRKWRKRIHRSRSSWYPVAQKIITDYTSRVPGSRCEKKHYAIAWHYRQAPDEYASYQARKLMEELELGLANLPVTIISGKKVLEVRAAEADKGVLANWYLETSGGNAVPIAFGDDRTDEDLFGSVKDRGLSFKVGPGPTNADFILPSQEQVLPFLQLLLQRLEQRFRHFNGSHSETNREIQRPRLTQVNPVKTSLG